MMTTRILHQLLDVSASRFPDNVAVEEAETGSIRYDELACLSDRVRDRLRSMGVEPCDRVGICMRKSADGVASLFGIMKAGAAYVPVDPTAPASRNAFIFHNCGVKVIIVESRLADRLGEEFKQLGFAPRTIVIDGVGAGVPLTEALDRLDALSPAPSVPSAVPDSSQPWPTSSTLRAQRAAPKE
jgi:acyl-CoA synthetase (AMP-forming)/AMP-acid ligase II